MKKLILIIVQTFAMLFLFSSCIFGGVEGNGNVIKKTHELEEFTKIDISGMFEVELTQGDQVLVTLEADENLHDIIEIYVKNGKLRVSTTKKIRDAEELKLHITYINLVDIDVSGAVEVRTMNQLKGDKLVIDGSGATELDLDVNVKSLDIDVSGASTTKLKGQASELSVDMSGAGELKAKKLETQIASLEISGAGSARVNVSDKLDISVSGAADVKYIGSPEIKQSISGAGSISKAD